MSLIDELLGCPLLEIDRSYWAAKRDDDKWMCERQYVHDWRKGERRHLDWGLDIAATKDCERLTEVWLLCPPSKTSPLGNTARIPIVRPYSAFSFKVGTADFVGVVGRGRQTMQAHIIGRVNDSDGSCVCFAWDPIEDGLITPETTVYDHQTGHIKVKPDGTPLYPMHTNVNHFGQIKVGDTYLPAMWRESLAPLGRIAFDRLGVRL